MKIAIFGSTGRVGQEVVKKALADGHEVFALARSPEKLQKHERLHVTIGDVRNAADVQQTIQHVDAIFSALGTDKTTTLTEAIPHMLEAMQQGHITRIVTIGTAGILQSRIDHNKLRYEAGDTNRRLTFAAEEHHKVYDLLKQSSVDWTIVCPTFLQDGEEEGDYRILKDYLPEEGKRITVGDTAKFAYEELIQGNHIGFRVGIAY